MGQVRGEPLVVRAVAEIPERLRIDDQRAVEDRPEPRRRRHTVNPEQELFEESHCAPPYLCPHSLHRRAAGRDNVQFRRRFSCCHLLPIPFRRSTAFACSTPRAFSPGRSAVNSSPTSAPTSIKLERPGAGDDTRGWGPPYLGDFKDLSAYFLSCNRGKRSLTLDIANPEGNAVFHELLAKSDVLIENFRSDSAEKLGLTPELLLAKHPRLVVCSISGFGRTGPLKDAPGYDFAIQAMSGLMSITGPPEGPPYKVGVALADVLTGLYASTAILACLHARERSGHGYAIDLGLLDCALAAQVNVAQAYLTSGVVPKRQGNAHLQIVPYQLFETADG